MKNYFKITCFVLGFIMLFSCNKSENPVETQGPPAASFDVSGYYPNSLGSNYIYQSEDKAGQKTVTIDRVDSDPLYTVQRVIDGFNGGAVSETIFKTENSKISFLIDEQALLAMVPDSMVQQYQLTLEVDKEMILVAQETMNGSEWNVLGVQVIFGGTFKFPVLKLYGKNMGVEQITIPNKSELVDAIKIKYTMDLTIPDPADPLNPETTTTGHYESFIWLAENIGMVKLSGNALFLNSFSTGNFSFVDTSSTLDQYLFDYELAP
jgi:hypothetical protein